MGIIDFKGKAAADNWKERLADLNDKTEVTLKGVGNSLQELKNNSEGSVVNILADTGVTVIDTTNDMIQSFRKIVDIFEELFGKLIEAIKGTADDVGSAKDAMTKF